jgi:hypothetical protein
MPVVARESAAIALELGPESSSGYHVWTRKAIRS